MAPKKNLPQKNVGSSASQQDKGKVAMPSSPIPHFGPAVEKEVVVAPDAFFEAERIVSKITDQARINKLFITHNIPLGKASVIARPAAEGERSCTPLDELFAAWSGEHFKAGAFLPLDQYFADFLNYVGLAPFQLPPNSYRLLAGLRYLFQKHEWEVPTPADILYFFCLKASPDQRGRGDGFYYLTRFPNTAAVIELPSHPNDFKDQFFMSTGFQNCEHHYFNRPRK